MILMKYISPGQQNLLIKMLNGQITKKKQDIYTTPFFYIQVVNLRKAGLVSRNYDKNNGIAVYELTDKGRRLAIIIKESIESVL